MKHRTIIFTAILLIAAVISSSACVDVRPRRVEGVTPPPTAEPAVTVLPATEIPTQDATVTPEPTVAYGESKDALGNTINGPEHYIRYVTFTDLIVYEEEGDTFLDGIINNSYSLPIVCAVYIVYHDEEDNEIARAQLQTRDGKYLLVLAPGENVVFAHILTDMTLTDQEFTLEFDNTVGVRPQQ